MAIDLAICPVCAEPLTPGQVLTERRLMVGVLRDGQIRTDRLPANHHSWQHANCFDPNGLGLPRRLERDDRQKKIESLLKESKYGAAYVDAPLDIEIVHHRAMGSPNNNEKGEASE